MDEVVCAICGKVCLPSGRGIEDFEYQSPGRYSYHVCPVCGLQAIRPQPSDTLLNLAYPETYHAYHEHFNFLSRWMKSVHWRKKARHYSRFLNPMDPVLELGCAFGDLLREFKQIGFNHVSGVEFNESAATRARERGLNIIQGDLDRVGPEMKDLKMIVMENFIEHVPDPLDLMKWCHQRLATDGVLVGETPNTGSWDYWIGGRFWGGYHSPRHFFLFNTSALRKIAEQSGFDVIYIKNIIQPAHWALTIQNAIKHHFPNTRLINGRSRFFTVLLLIFLPINAIQHLFSKTSLVEFAFRKRGCKQRASIA